MYNSAIFKADDKILHFIDENPFSTIVSSELALTHLPMLRFSGDESNLVLIGHMMTHSEHYDSFLKNKSGVLIFVGNHSYISSRNYNNIQSASTWNYESVTCYGNVEFLDEAGTFESISLLSKRMELPDSGNHIEDMDQEYIKSNLKHIRGFHFNVTKITSVFKMSQNKTKQERENIVKDLEENGKLEMATAMKKY